MAPEEEKKDDRDEFIDWIREIFESYDGEKVMRELEEFFNSPDGEEEGNDNDTQGSTK